MYSAEWWRICSHNSPTNSHAKLVLKPYVETMEQDLLNKFTAVTTKRCRLRTQYTEDPMYICLHIQWKGGVVEKITKKPSNITAIRSMCEKVVGRSRDFFFFASPEHLCQHLFKRHVYSWAARYWALGSTYTSCAFTGERWSGNTVEKDDQRLPSLHSPTEKPPCKHILLWIMKGYAL